MSESNTKKHLKTYEEAILELGSFISLLWVLSMY